MFCKIYSVSSVLHHTMMDVLICDFLGSLVTQNNVHDSDHTTVPPADCISTIHSL